MKEKGNSKTNNNIINSINNSNNNTNTNNNNTCLVIRQECLCLCVSLSLSVCWFKIYILYYYLFEENNIELRRIKMLIKEYHIPLPLSVEEYRVAQLYMIAVSTPQDSATYY